MQNKTDIDAKQSKQLIQQNKGKNNFILLDCRTPAQFTAAHLQNAINICSTQIQNRLDQLDKQKNILIYCRSGVRSNKSAIIMRQKGFKIVTNMLGGINAWIALGYPTLNEQSIKKDINQQSNKNQ